MYEASYVAFIDILGFRKHIEHSEYEPNIAHRIHDALLFLFEQKPSEHRGLWSVSQTPFERMYDHCETSGVLPTVHTFSDNIVLSTPVGSGLKFSSFLEAVYTISAELLCRGFVTRGGIAKGDLYHNHRMVFGPGLVEAHRLESQEATFPRILITSDVRMDLENCTERERPVDVYLRREAGDKYDWLDVLGCALIPFHRLPHLEPWLDAVRPVIKSNIENAHDDRAREQANWLATYFNHVLQENPNVDTSPIPVVFC